MSFGRHFLFFEGCPTLPIHQSTHIRSEGGIRRATAGCGLIARTCRWMDLLGLGYSRGANRTKRHIQINAIYKFEFDEPITRVKWISFRFTAECLFEYTPRQRAHRAFLACRPYTGYDDVGRTHSRQPRLTPTLLPQSQVDAISIYIHHHHRHRAPSTMLARLGGAPFRFCRRKNEIVYDRGLAVKIMEIARERLIRRLLGTVFFLFHGTSFVCLERA